MSVGRKRNFYTFLLLFFLGFVFRLWIGLNVCRFLWRGLRVVIGLSLILGRVGVMGVL
jgi:hypothetical protein